MSKFLIEPNKIYDVNFCFYWFFDSLEADEQEEYEEA